jgi:hypothetical protein
MEIACGGAVKTVLLPRETLTEWPITAGEGAIVRLNGNPICLRQILEWHNFHSPAVLHPGASQGLYSISWYAE